MAGYFPPPQDYTDWVGTSQEEADHFLPNNFHLPCSSTPSDADFSGPRISYPESYYQTSMRPELLDTFPLALHDHGPADANQLCDTFSQPLNYLTTPAPDSDLPGITIVPPDERFEWESITPPRYTSSPMQASLDEVAFDNDNNEKVIITVETQNHIIDVDDTPAQIGPSSFVHPDYLLAPVVGEQQATWYDTAGLAKSTGDAPGTTFQDSSMQGIFSEFFHFIDSNPLLNDSFHAAKEKVASYPIVVASTARRTNPATLKCDICQATFTRSHNLGYHKDSHFGIKRHPAVCGKKFGTPSGSKRHESTCPKCKEVSGSMN